MRTVATIMLTLATSLPAAAQPVMYSVLDLGGGASAINAVGQSTGVANHMAVRVETNGQLTPLGTLGGTTSAGNGINSSGQVVGNSYTAGNSATHAFVTTGGGFPIMSDIGTLGGDSYAQAINDNGQVAGYSYLAGNSIYHAFRTTPGGVIDTTTDLGTFGGNKSLAMAINASGQVTGYAQLPGNIPHAFRTTATGSLSTADDLGTLGGATSFGNAINASGQVVGYSAAAGGLHAFRSTPNGQPISLQDLGTLGGTISQAHGINALGIVVGDSYTDAANTIDIGFVFDTSMHNLNDLVPAGWDITSANGINDVGQIVAGGSFQGGPNEALLLTPMPVPEPSALALTGLAGTWFAWGRRRRTAR